jgi:L-asparagine oxygenase
VRDLPPTAVLTGSVDEPSLVVDCNAMVAEDTESERALAEVRALLPEVADAVALDAGDLLIIDNRVAAHARSSWTPRYDGRDRWLQRMSVVCDFRPSQEMREPLAHRCRPMVEFRDSVVRA